ncbi:MAG: hypothetical protein R2827_06895 [Bdellovibrionales bacterium]
MYKNLMQSVPDGIKIEELVVGIQNSADIVNVHHVHVWQLDDKKYFWKAILS